MIRAVYISTKLSKILFEINLLLLAKFGIGILRISIVYKIPNRRARTNWPGRVSARAKVSCMQ